MITINTVEHIEFNQETNVYSFELNQFLDGKPVSGRNNIFAKIKSDDAEILTPEVKLSKSTKIEFTNPNEQVVIYIDLEGQDPIPVNLTIEKEQNDEIEETANLDDGSDGLEEINDLDESEEESENGFPILRDTSNVEFDYIFTSQVKEILSKEITTKETENLYNRAISITNRIVFFRDTNTNIYYWITKDVVLSNFDFVQLLIDVNEYNTKQKEQND